MDIIDRENETIQISEQINASKSTEVLVLYGKIGYGKSMTAQKLCLSGKINRPVIMVKEPFPEICKEGDYIWIFFQRLYKTYNKKYYWFNRQAHKKTYGYFLNKFYKNDHLQLKELISGIPSNLNSWLSLIKFISTIFQYLFNPVLHIFTSYKEPHFSKDCISQYIAYIIYILKDYQSAIILDNIQNIDDLSRKYLVQCISRLHHSNVFFILEYTLSENNKLKIADLRGVLEKYGIQYNFRLINKLNNNDAYTTVKEFKPDNIDEYEYKKEILKYYVNISKGDLKDLFSYAISFQLSPSYNDGTELQLKTLENESSLYAFIIIVFCNGKIHKSLLWDIYEKSNFKLFLNLQDGIYNLEANCLIEELDDFYFIPHKSTIKKWKEIENDTFFSKYNLNVLNELKSYFEIVQEKNLYRYISENDCMLALVQIYARLNPFKIYSVIDKIEKLANNLITPEQVLYYYDKLLQEISPNRRNFLSLYYQAFRFFCGLEMYDHAYKVLKSIENDVVDTDEYNINQALILYLMNNWDESLVSIKRKIPVECSRIKLYYQLLLILNYRLKNQNQMCILVAKEIEDNLKEYENLKEFAYFLCLSDLFMSNREAITYVSKGIQLFQKHKLYKEADRFKITLSYLYGSLCSPVEALNILKECQYYINDQILYKAIFFNNKSAYNLLNGNFSVQVSDDLNRAEDYAIDIFSKLVILNNHLIWCMENEKNEMGNYICCRIIDLIKDMPEKQLNSLLYYNLFLFYQRQRKYTIATHYQKKSFELVEYSCNLRWRFQFQGPLTVEQQKFLRYPWNVCFLARWEITYLPE